MAGANPAAEESVATNTAILSQAPSDLPALNRLGRAHEALGSVDAARDAFTRVLELDPANQIASRRLRQLERKHD